QALVREISSGEGKLQIENCKLQIANSSDADRTRHERPFATTGTEGPDQFAISNLQSPAQRAGTRICNLTSGLEPVGGAVPLGSRFYVVRPADQEFREAIARRDSVVLVKGARQVGKTSLLARGL